MRLEPLIGRFKALCATFPDQPTGENTVYQMADAGTAAFATSFMQSPSFLAQQTALARGRGISNCETLFQTERIPTDNCIRSLLDPVPPQQLFPMFSDMLSARVTGGGFWGRIGVVPAPGWPRADRAGWHRIFLLAEALVPELFVSRPLQR